MGLARPRGSGRSPCQQHRAENLGPALGSTKSLWVKHSCLDLDVFTLPIYSVNSCLLIPKMILFYHSHLSFPPLRTSSFSVHALFHNYFPHLTDPSVLIQDTIHLPDPSAKPSSCKQAKKQISKNPALRSCTNIVPGYKSCKKVRSSYVGNSHYFWSPPCITEHFTSSNKCTDDHLPSRPASSNKSRTFTRPTHYKSKASYSPSGQEGPRTKISLMVLTEETIVD